MTILNVTRTHYLEDCQINSYKGYFIQWEIKAEGFSYNSIFDFCQKYCIEEQFSKEQFDKDLKYILDKTPKGHHAKFNLKSFYELNYDKNKEIWIYTFKRILQDYT